MRNAGRAWGRILTLSALYVVLSGPAAAATCTDLDGDGYGPGCPAGNDCDDGDPAVHPMATDVCGDGIDQNCNGNPDDREPDAGGQLFCLSVSPTGGYVGQPLALEVRADHPLGVSTLWLVQNGDYLSKTVHSCGGATSCLLGLEVSQAYEGPRQVEALLFRGATVVKSAILSLGFQCPGESCPQDPLLEPFFGWMRQKGYPECIASRHLLDMAPIQGRTIVRTTIGRRPTGLTRTYTVPFYDVVPTDPQATSQPLGAGEGPPCQYSSVWPGWCPTPVSADWQFLQAHFRRTFGIELVFAYERLDVNYTQVIGAPQLVNGYYRFPSRFSFEQQFPAHALVHYAVQTYDGLPIVSMTGASHVASFDILPSTYFGATATTHEWGHTWGLPHSFLGSMPIGLDSVMANGYAASSLMIDPTSPAERYALEPTDGYVDDASFATGYASGLVGSSMLPTCGTVDPSLPSVTKLAETAQAVTFRLTLSNGASLPVGFVTLRAFDSCRDCGFGPPTPIETRTIAALGALETRTVDFTVARAAAPSGWVEFVVDPDGGIVEVDETNNRRCVRM